MIKEKIMGIINNGAFKKIAIIALVAVLVIVALSVGIGAATNTYKTPIKTMEKYANMKKYYDSFDEQKDLLNGLLKSETKAMAKLEKSTEDYKDNLADAKEDFKDSIDEMKEEYGKNYKYDYKITDKEKLDKDELKDIRDGLRDRADMLEEWIEETEDFDSDDWEDLADDMGYDGDKSKAKKYISVMKDTAKFYKKAKVTAGYTLTVEVTLDGSELDEPEELGEREIVVLKVNGRWVAQDDL